MDTSIITGQPREHFDPLDFAVRAAQLRNLRSEMQQRENTATREQALTEQGQASERLKSLPQLLTIAADEPSYQAVRTAWSQMGGDGSLLPPTWTGNEGKIAALKDALDPNTPDRKFLAGTDAQGNSVYGKYDSQSQRFVTVPGLTPPAKEPPQESKEPTEIVSPKSPGGHRTVWKSNRGMFYEQNGSPITTPVAEWKQPPTVTPEDQQLTRFSKLEGMYNSDAQLKNLQNSVSAYTRIKAFQQNMQSGTYDPKFNDNLMATDVLQLGDPKANIRGQLVQRMENAFGSIDLVKRTLENVKAGGQLFTPSQRQAIYEMADQLYNNSVYPTLRARTLGHLKAAKQFGVDASPYITNIYTDQDVRDTAAANPKMTPAQVEQAFHAKGYIKQ